MVLISFIISLLAITVTSSPTHLTDVRPGHNTIGAIIFFSYIFVALYFTSYIVLSISRIPSHSPASPKSSYGKGSRHNQKGSRKVGWTWRHGAFAMFCALSLVSFVVLSWNMLSFLVVSYLEWSATHGLTLPSHLDSPAQLWQHVQYVWYWATGSTLFQTFAEDLISYQSQWKVVRAALIYSYTWNSWMSTLGHGADVPNLWTYFVLDQILPVSFTQNLFCAALVRASPASSHVSKPTSTRHTSLLLRSIGLSFYCAALYWIPTTIKTKWFFPTLFALRVLLLTPYLVDHLTLRQQKSARSPSEFTATSFNYFLVALSTVALGSIGAPELKASRQIPTPSSNANYAAAALSNDMMIGFASGLAVLLLARR